MAGNAGLGYDVDKPNQEGLNEPQTMQDRYVQMQQLRGMGYKTSQVYEMMGIETSPPEAAPADDAQVGIMGDLGYGIRNVGEGLVGGTGELLEDWTPLTGAGEFLKGVGEYVGPSEEQEAAQAAEDAWRKQKVADGEMTETGRFAAEAGDAIVESSPSFVAAAAGGAAGGAAFGALFGGVGAAPGAIVGAVVASAPMIYKEMLGEAAAQGHDIDDPAVQKKALLGTAVGTAMEVAVPLKVLSKLNKSGALDIVLERVAKKGAKEFLQEGAEEGFTEVGQSALGKILFDEELSAQLSKDDKAELFPYIVDNYGREFALAFVSGAGIGGVAGGTSGARQQMVANAGIQANANKLAKSAETSGMSTEQLR